MTQTLNILRFRKILRLAGSEKAIYACIAVSFFYLHLRIIWIFSDQVEMYNMII
jgi:cell division protein FtsL